MQNKEVYIKNKLTDFANMFKTVANFSILAVKQKDFQSVKEQYNTLNRLFLRIMDFIKISCSEDIYKKCSEYDFENLPEYLTPLKTVDIYMKILSMKYTNMELNDTEEKLFALKMSIDFNYDEDIPYINLANFLYTNGKYEEAIELCKFIKETKNSAPAWEISAKSYRELKRYEDALEDYTTYISINDGDKEAKKELEELYKESLK